MCVGVGVGVWVCRGGCEGLCRGGVWGCVGVLGWRCGWGYEGVWGDYMKNKICYINMIYYEYNYIRYIHKSNLMKI